MCDIYPNNNRDTIYAIFIIATYIIPVLTVFHISLLYAYALHGWAHNTTENKHSSQFSKTKLKENSIGL